MTSPFQNGSLASLRILIFFCIVLSSLIVDGGKTQAETKKNRYQRSKLTNDESESVADKRRMLLTTGEDKAVDLDFDVTEGANGVTAGNPQIVLPQLVKIGGKRQQINFKPLKAGETTVTIRDTDGSIRLIFYVRVTGSSLLRIAGEIRNLLRDIEGVDVRIVGSKVIVEGDVLVPSDYGKLYVVLQDKAYSDFVINLAGVSPLAMQLLAKKIQEDIGGFAPNVKTRVVNGTIILEGSAPSDAVRDHAVSVANLYLPEMKPSTLLEKDPTVQKLPKKLIISEIVVDTPPPKKQEKLVRVSVHFVQLSKDYNKLFGFKWAPGFTSDPQISVGQTVAGGAGASTSTGAGGVSFTGTISSLIPKLQGAQAAGYARVLRTGTVIVRSGQPAKLNEQQDLAFPQLGPNGQVVSGTKTVGLAVAVTPLILGQSEDIQMELELDQTNVVGKAPVTGGPPITAIHKVNTKLYVKSNESAAVAGVVSSDIGTDFNKDDPLSVSTDATSTTTPLFSLLRSKSFRKTKSQFVIFVTPQIIDNASDGTEDLKKNFRIKVR